MAGAGKKTFTAGETLTASDVNTYLMEQSVMVFGGTAARSSAIPTPSEGMTTYRTDTQQIESYDGAEWRGMSGMQLVKKQTIGTTVSSVTVTDAFSATYNSYKILVSGGTSSANAGIVWNLNGITSGNYSVMNYASLASAAANSINQANAGFFNWCGWAATTTVYMDFDIHNPFTAKMKVGHGRFIELSNTGNAGASHLYNASTTSATGFTITPQGGTLTGGTIYVYGYGT